MSIAICLLFATNQTVIGGLAHTTAQDTQVTVLYASGPGDNALELPDTKAGVFSNAVVREAHLLMNRCSHVTIENDCQPTTSRGIP